MPPGIIIDMSGRRDLISDALGSNKWQSAKYNFQMISKEAGR
jgi:hypothetical protein